VATLLHLSDLHLGDEDYATFADHKVEVIDPAARQGRSRALVNTLQALGKALQRDDVKLDAVVISGDVAYQADARGFTKLPGMLANLGPALPTSSRILVVPGNHDVKWMTAPGSPDRYADFIKGVRSQGYVTPLLEGIDLDADGKKLTDTSPVITASDGSFVLVGLNSSDHCGVQERIDSSLQADIATVEADSTNSAAQSLLAAWRRRTLYDVAHVSPAQRSAAPAELNSATVTADDPIRIAVMHHQLLPISLEEEVKPFEAIVNLAQVRDWLARNEVGVVLHGHKHVAVTYEDRYVPLSGDDAQAHRFIVSSVGTVGQGQPMENVVGRLITVEPRRRRSVGKVTIRDVRSVMPGVPIDLSALKTKAYRTRVDWPRTSHVIEGTSSRDVHEQILDLTDDDQDLPKPLVCRVSNPQGAQTPPSSYTDLNAVPEGEDWFDDLVSLWQASHRLTAMPFNHGERIFDLAGTNQFDLAIDALASRETSSRAVISVFIPGKDNPADGSKDFPAFCLVHLLVVAQELRVVAYFRKQEMRYWWGVNLAELAGLQRSAVDKINQVHDNTALRAGEITTVTAIPTAGNQIPRVAVPQVDRWVDENPGRLLRMALLPYHPTMEESAAALSDWKKLADESYLPKTTAPDGSPVPVLGLQQIQENLTALKQAFGEVPLATRLAGVLDLAAAWNDRYREAARSTGAKESDRANVMTGHTQILESLAELEQAVTAKHVSAIDNGAPAPPGTEATR
jgi:3',5'-cyclic AMP phosphodiesterase CpdA